jgi:multidrug efflux pump subunit AcrA (membrane-fusion protein)
VKKLRQFIIPVVVLALGAALMFAFLDMREETPKRAHQPRVRIVDACEVRPGPVAAQIDAYGTVSSAQPLELFSEVAGTILSGDLPFQPGQSFVKGDVLLRLDDRQVQLSRQSAISDLLSALATVLPELKTDFPQEFETFQIYFESVSFDKPLPPLPQAEKQRIKLFLSRFNVYRLYFAARNLEIEIEKYELRAPFGGSIVATALRPGSSARNGSLLGAIINLEDLEVEIPVPASDVMWIELDQPVGFVSAEFKGEWRGRISRVGSSINLRTQTVPVYVELEDRPAGALFEGLFFEALLPGKIIENALEIPRRAIYNERFVYVVNEGRLEYREVTVARKQKTSVIVNGGLNVGDTLVLEPLQGVAPGMPAEPRIVTLSEQLQ